MRDTIEISRWLQLIVGTRFDRFEMSALDMNTNINRARTDNKMSPQAAVIVKPIESLSIYTAYSISYLPASGDQFSSLNDGTLILQPQKFENTEVGVKWNINPKLLFSAAIYNLEPHQPADRRSEQSRLLLPVRQPRGCAASRPSLNGYVTDAMAVFAGLCLYGCEDHQRDVGDRRGRQSRAARAVQPVRMVEQVPVHADVGGRARHHLFLGFVCVVGRHREAAELRALRCRRSTPRSMRTGARNSRSRTSSTRDIGRRPTATTTSRPARGAR